MPTNTSSQFPFLGLPRELRDMVYNFVYEDGVHCQDKDFEIKINPIGFGLHQANRQLYRETLAYFIRTQTWVIRSVEQRSGFEKWLLADYHEKPGMNDVRRLKLTGPDTNSRLEKDIDFAVARCPKIERIEIDVQFCKKVRSEPFLWNWDAGRFGTDYYYNLITINDIVDHSNLKGLLECKDLREIKFWILDSNDSIAPKIAKKLAKAFQERGRLMTVQYCQKPHFQNFFDGRGLVLTLPHGNSGSFDTSST